MIPCSFLLLSRFIHVLPNFLHFYESSSTVFSLFLIPLLSFCPESIEKLYVEDQASLPTPLTLRVSTSAKCLSFSLFLCVAVELTEWGEGAGEEAGAKSYDGEKAWSSINHSILSAFTPPPFSPSSAAL
jgi:hypothetical protein